MTKNDAIRRGYDDAIFVAPTGEIREATAANVFAVRDNVLVTPPKTDAILHGVTRDFVLDGLERLGLPWEERHLTVEELAASDEVFVSSTAVDILGVTRLNDAPVGSGEVGPVTQQLYEQFRQAIAELCR
jgi:branched-chain amino acid aminotransferase